MEKISALIAKCVLLDIPEIEYALRYIGDRIKSTGTISSDDTQRLEVCRTAMIGRAERIGWTHVADEIKAI
jgi:hypothetical protein